MQAVHGVVSGQLFQSTGLEWNLERLRTRYAFLQKLGPSVRFDLIYYPYWLLLLSGSVKWKWFAQKTVHQLKVSDALLGKIFRISSPPELHKESLAVTVPQSGNPFIPTNVMREDGACRAQDVRVHQAPCLVQHEEAQQRGEASALRDWTRHYNRPLGFSAEIRVQESILSLLYKPFWLMTPVEEATPTLKRLFVFDATTGLGGVSEFWNVVEYVLPFYEGTEKPHSDVPTPALQTTF